MRYWIYALVILYVIWPLDLLSDFFVGGGWIDDLLLLSILGWYHFVYRQRRKGDIWNENRTSRGTGGTRKGYGRYGGTFEDREQAGKTPDLRTPHEVLGIDRNASTDEIRSAYLRLVNQYHPDKVTHLGDEFRVLAEKRFKEIQQAYQVLMPEK